MHFTHHALNEIMTLFYHWVSLDVNLMSSFLTLIFQESFL